MAYRRIALMPKRRVWVDNGQGGVHVPVGIAEGSKVTVGDPAVCGAQGQQVSKLACCTTNWHATFGCWWI